VEILSEEWRDNMLPPVTSPFKASAASKGKITAIFMFTPDDGSTANLQNVLFPSPKRYNEEYKIYVSV
jgi:hypothetical protein